MIKRSKGGSGLRRALSVCLIGLMSLSTVAARELSLDEALNIALNRTTRGEMIEGNLEVAEQLYSARRINMYVPEISINGEIPSYRLAQSYRPYRNPLDKEVFETRNLDYNSFIELKQTLITGGTLTATADLVAEEQKYPDVRFEAGSGLFVNEDIRSGSFNFSLDQPLFRPSSVRNELHNRRDDLEIARVTRTEAEADLRQEVVEAYIGLLQQSLEAEIAGFKLEQASLKEEIDSLKLIDGVVSEEDYLLSASERLDAELESHAAETELAEKRRELMTLLDWDEEESIELVPPDIPEPINDVQKTAYVTAWEQAAPIKKAEHQFSKAKREADFAAAGHGLTGDLTASYSLGRQDIEVDRVVDEQGSGGMIEENIKTDSWTVALQFRLPLWDGGAGSAAVRAARYEAEQARYEFNRSQATTRATLINLVNQLEVAYQRMDIIQKQIELARNREEIARGRFEDGRISRLTLLDSKVFLLETRSRYLEELQSYLSDRIELESMYLRS